MPAAKGKNLREAIPQPGNGREGLSSSFEGIILKSLKELSSTDNLFAARYDVNTAEVQSI